MKRHLLTSTINRIERRLISEKKKRFQLVEDWHVKISMKNKMATACQCSSRIVSSGKWGAGFWWRRCVNSFFFSIKFKSVYNLGPPSPLPQLFPQFCSGENCKMSQLIHDNIQYQRASP